MGTGIPCKPMAQFVLISMALSGSNLLCDFWANEVVTYLHGSWLSQLSNKAYQLTGKADELGMVGQFLIFAFGCYLESLCRASIGCYFCFSCNTRIIALCCLLFCRICIWCFYTAYYVMVGVIG